VPSAGTKGGFTVIAQGRSLDVSSSGGGLFGRPATRKSPGRFLFAGGLLNLGLASRTQTYRLCHVRYLHGLQTSWKSPT